MDSFEYYLTRFFEQLSTPVTPDFSTWWLLPTLLSGLALLLLMVHFVSKTNKWKQGQVRFEIAPLFKQPARSFPKGRSAHVIDFVAAGEKLRCVKKLHSYELSHTSVAAEIRALRGKERDSFDFTTILGRRGANDDGPKAA